jgi:hypothetical protein
MTVNVALRAGQVGPKLSDLAGGAVEERWQAELHKALENIEDPNTDARKAREITIKVTILPDETRNAGAVGISATVKLSAQKRAMTMVYMGRTAEGLRAIEHNPQQLLLDAQPPLQTPALTPNNVTPIGAGK